MFSIRTPWAGHRTNLWRLALMQLWRAENEDEDDNEEEEICLNTLFNDAKTVQKSISKPFTLSLSGSERSVKSM